MSPTAPPTLLREAKVRELTGLSRTTRWRLERDGRFPQRVQLGPRCVGWVEGEVRAWLARAVANRIPKEETTHDTRID